MKRKRNLALVFILAVIITAAFKNSDRPNAYVLHYRSTLSTFGATQQDLLQLIAKSDLHADADREKIMAQIALCRQQLKTADLWLRYLEPVAYKKINGPLPVEWETEVFEKFEKPYKREGGGLTLAAIYLDEDGTEKEALLGLIQASATALRTYGADSITKELDTYHHFYLCNRLFLLNLAAIYTTGFECPDTAAIIPELRNMLSGVKGIYTAFNESFPVNALPAAYLALYDNMQDFCSKQAPAFTHFDHFTFIRDFVNPLYAYNQQLIREYKVVSHSYVDYSLNKQNTSLFDKSLYRGQNAKGIFHRVQDPEVLAEIDRVGRLLFYDPLLSGNNERSCASCHSSTQYFTDTALRTSFHFDHQTFLARNTPSLINVGFNHLVMQDGKHISLQHQTKAVITNPGEMGSSEQEVLKKILSCAEYKRAFTKLLKQTPQETEITLDHIASAITYHYDKYSHYSAPFDMAMNKREAMDESVQAGFNIFMSKAQCATCHFVPQFNGVKPPFVSSEFEVIGVPADTAFSRLSPDQGRYTVNPAEETMNAFRTGSIRNAAHTAPYMHNGVFGTLQQVIDFYDAGGGAGRKLHVSNQTLAADSLHLSVTEKKQLLAFIHALSEDIPFEAPPVKLPASKDQALNNRKAGGTY